MPSVRSRTVDFETPWFQVISKTVKDMPGSEKDEQYYAIKQDDYVSILALDREKNFILVRQYRPATESYTIEVPSGHVDNNEAPEDAAKRELLEETGYQARKTELLGCLVPDTGRMLNKLWCFFADDVEKVRPDNEPEEGIEVLLSSGEELKEHIASSELEHALNLAIIMLAETKGKINFL